MKRPLIKKSDKHIAQNSLKTKAGLAALVLFILFFALFQQVTSGDVFSCFAFMGDARNIKMAGDFLFSITSGLHKDINNIKEKADILVLSFSADDIMNVSADIRKPVENLLKIEDVDIDITGVQAVDFAVAKITGKSPDTAFKATEKLFTLDDVIVRKTKDERVEIHVPAEAYKGFYISLKEEVRDKLNGSEISERKKLLAMIVAKNIKYQPCGFQPDGKSQKTIQKHLDYFVATDLKSFLDEIGKHITGRKAMEKAMDYIGVPRRETARMVKESFLADKGAMLETGTPAAIKGNIASADLAGKPVLPTGTLSPESMFAFSEMSEGSLDANMEKVEGLLDVAFGNIAEDQRSVHIEGINNEESRPIERIQAFALLLGRSGILETDVGVIIDARTDGLNPSMIARMINGGKNSFVIKPFILIDSRDMYSELVIMGMPAERMILKEKGTTPIEAIKVHMARYKINVAPHNMSFTVIASEGNMDMLKEECMGSGSADTVCNFVVIDSEDMLKSHNSKLLYANFINVVNRLVMKDKPSVMAIGEKGINAVKGLYTADTGNTLNMTLVKEPDLGKMMERFVDCLREKGAAL